MAGRRDDRGRHPDGQGRAYDFHALRHQFISDMVAAGVHPKDAQALARHGTITLTMDRYAHVRTANLRAALDRLPDLAGTPPCTLLAPPLAPNLDTEGDGGGRDETESVDGGAPDARRKANAAG
jgi:hypothetical protein